MSITIKSVYNKFKEIGSTLVGKVNWTTKRVISPEDLNQVRSLMKDNYYIILTRHNGHLSTYAIDFAHWVVTGRWGYYGHILLNVEDEVKDDSDYSFIESTITGVHYSTFPMVFDSQVGSICLMKPKAVTIEEWAKVLDKSRTDIGKPYDLALDPSQTDKLDCVELVRDALKGQPDYATDYKDLEAVVQKYKALDPQMVYECPDFEVVWEKRV